MITTLLFILGLVGLLVGAEWFVRGASRLAALLGISPLVIGLTVVAYGTSAPELAVSAYSAFTGSADIALGNVVGSCIANVLLILGVSALAAPLAVSSQLIRWEVPVMIGVSVASLLAAWDGCIQRWEGVILFAGCISYSFWTVRVGRRQTAATLATLAAAGDVPPPREGERWGREIFLILAGMAMLVVGSQFAVRGAVAFARFLGISELVIGLTIVAVGTSLPELATSVIASLRGQREIAVGNVVGSNIFNILMVLGVTAAVAPAGVPVAHAALRFDIPVMIAVALACLPIFFTGARISRWEGAFFLLYYAGYVALLVIRASRHEEMTARDTLLAVFILPMLAIAVLGICQRSLRTLSGPRNGSC